MISVNPASELQPNLSTGFLFKKPLRMEAAFTLKERGIRMVFSKITEKNRTDNDCQSNTDSLQYSQIKNTTNIFYIPNLSFDATLRILRVCKVDTKIVPGFIELLTFEDNYFQYWIYT